MTLRSDDVRALARGGALFLAAGAAARALEWVFASRPMFAVVIGAFLLDLWAQRMGARWMPRGDAPARAQSTTTFFGWLGTGLALGVLVVGSAAVLGAAHTSLGRVSAASIGIGVARTAAYAFRDELLYRGIPLALTNGHVPRRWSLAFLAALGAAPMLLSGSDPGSIALGASSALFFAIIWQLGAGGFAAWAAHTGWRIAIEVVAGGSIFEVAYDKGALPSTEGAAGLPAYLAAIAFVLAAVAVYRRGRAIG